MKTTTGRILVVSAAVAALLVAGLQARADQIVNGGFETGDFTGWTADANSFPMYIVTSPVHSGTYAAQIAGYSYDPDTLSQTVSTVSGQKYELEAWVYQVLAGPTISLDVTWDGTTVYSQLNPIVGDAYQEFSATVTGTGSDTLVFTSANDPAYTYLDDVSLNASAVPEPGSLSLLALGAAALLRKRFRRGARSASAS